VTNRPPCRSEQANHRPHETHRIPPHHCRIATSIPIALDGHKESENTGVLVITVFGSYKADVRVTKPRE